MVKEHQSRQQLRKERQGNKRLTVILVKSAIVVSANTSHNIIASTSLLDFMATPILVCQIENNRIMAFIPFGTTMISTFLA